MKTIGKMTLIFLALCILLGFVLSFPQSVKCDLGSLILQENMMPLHWKRLWGILPPALPKEGAVDAVNVVFDNGDQIAQHTMYRYTNGVLAFFFLRINNQVFFPSGQWIWSELEGSEDWLLHWDEARIRCRNSNDPLLGFKCDAVIRYGQYISEFSSPIGEGVMSQEEFKAIVFAIDEQITSCLQQSRNQR